MIFSEELEQWRKKQRWSKATAAKFLYDVPYQTYIRWEYGKPPKKYVQCLILHLILERPINMHELEG